MAGMCSINFPHHTQGSIAYMYITLANLPALVKHKLVTECECQWSLVVTGLEFAEKMSYLNKQHYNNSMNHPPQMTRP